MFRTDRTDPRLLVCVLALVTRVYDCELALIVALPYVLSFIHMANYSLEMYMQKIMTYPHGN